MSDGIPIPARWQTYTPLGYTVHQQDDIVQTLCSLTLTISSLSYPVLCHVLCHYSQHDALRHHGQYDVLSHHCQRDALHHHGQHDVLCHHGLRDKLCHHGQYDVLRLTPSLSVLLCHTNQVVNLHPRGTPYTS